MENGIQKFFFSYKSQASMNHMYFDFLYIIL